MISDGKGQCSGWLCDSQEQSSRRCTCSWKTPKLLLWNPLGSHIKSVVNKCLVISLENIGLPTMTPGRCRKDQQQLKATANICKQASMERKNVPPAPKPASTSLPCWVLALIWGISVTLNHSYTLGANENSLPAPIQHIYNYNCTHLHGLSMLPHKDPDHSATRRRTTWHLYTNYCQTWQARKIRTDWRCTHALAPMSLCFLQHHWQQITVG